MMVYTAKVVGTTVLPRESHFTNGALKGTDAQMYTHMAIQVALLAESVIAHCAREFTLNGSPSGIVGSIPA